MNIAKFDNHTYKTFRAELEALLNKYDGNVDFTVGSAKVDSTGSELEIKIKAKIRGAVTETDHILENEIKENNLVRSKNGYTLVDFKPRNWKMPYIFTDPSGKRYKGDLNTIRRRFGA